MIYHHAQLHLGDVLDSEARLFVKAMPGTDIAYLSGRLYGPQCVYARTLAAEYSLRQVTDAPDALCLSELVVPDPCYWTPALPFLYNLELALTTCSGETINEKATIGLRRWGAGGANFRLEGRRIVLRGCRVESFLAEELQEARSAETALLIDAPSDAFCAEANRVGVPLLVDLREAGDQFTSEVARLAWNPAVLIALANPAQLQDALPIAKSSSRLLMGQLISSVSLESETSAIACDALVVELQDQERPPAWLSGSGKPVIAVRRGATYADLAEARAQCDRLQAALAPEFNLGGYFNSS